MQGPRILQGGCIPTLIMQILSSFSDQEPFDVSLFVEFRKRLGIEQINAINEKILKLSIAQQKDASSDKKKDGGTAFSDTDQYYPKEVLDRENLL